MTPTSAAAKPIKQLALALGLKKQDAKKLVLALGVGLLLFILGIVAITLAISDGNPAWWVSALLSLGAAGVAVLWCVRVVTRRRAAAVRKRVRVNGVTQGVDYAVDAPATVTVVIPAYREQKWLSAALDSLRSQTYPLWRAVVVDDQSDDNTSTIGVSYATKDPRISVLRLRRNSGLPAARNAGLTQVDTPYVLFLDADDALFPEALERRVEVLASDQGIAGSYGGVRQVDFDADWLEESTSGKLGRSTRRISLISSAGENPFGIHQVLMRTDRVLELGGFNEQLRRGGEDVDFWARSLRSGHEYVGTGRVDGIYRQTPTSMVSAGTTAHLETVVGLLQSTWTAQGSQAEVTHSSGIDGDLGEVLQRAMVENRLLRYLGMAALGADRTEFDHVVDQLRERAPLSLSRAAAITPIISGVTRSQRREGAVYDVAARETARRSLTSIDELFAASSTEPLPRRDHPTWAVVVENRAQVVAVLAALSTVAADHAPVFIVADALDADMGALELLSQRAPDSSWRSLAKYVLDGVAYQTVVVPQPISWVGRLVAEVAGERGSAIRELNFPWSDKVAVDDEDTQAARTNELPTPAPVMSLSELSGVASRRGDAVRKLVLARCIEVPGLETKDGSAGDYRGLDRPTIERLMELNDKHKGERCVVIGNGPSLNKTDLDLLKGTPTFGVNGIYYADTRLPEPLAFYVVEDTKVFEENTADVLAYGREKAQTFILPTLYRPSLGPQDDPVLFRMNGGFYRSKDLSCCRPRFSTNAAEVLYCGQSVTIINLQLAYWMGFSEVGLIGMDFSYAIPQGTEIKGSLYTSAGDDPNHFDPRYFGAGKTWKDPRLNRVLSNYELAKSIYESDGRRIVNCTVGGALEAFDRVDLADFTRS